MVTLADVRVDELAIPVGTYWEQSRPVINAAGYRAVKSFAQALLLWGADAGFNVLEVAVGPAVGVGIGAAALSLLTSLTSAPAGEKGTTSFLPGAR